MKTILVPCDFSAPSREAFKVAISMASTTNVEVIILNAINVPAMYDSTFAGGVNLGSETDALEEDARRAFEKMNRDLNKTSVKTTFEVLCIDVISSINHIIDTHNVDLVVMGTSGASGLKEIFIGSNTEKVVRTSRVPVLAIHNTTDSTRIKTILLPSTLGLDQDEFISRVKDLQAYFDASLQILLINTPANFVDDDKAKHDLEEFAKHYHLKHYSLHFKNYRNIEEGIIDFANNKNIDLIAMGTHARKGLSHLFNGSITEDVVNHIKCPVWTYPLTK